MKSYIKLSILLFLFQFHLQAQAGFLAPELRVSKWFDKDCKASKFSINENKGKYIVLFNWQSWCPGCHSSGLPTFSKLSHHFRKSKKIAFATIQTVFEGHSRNSEDEVCTTMKKYGIKTVAGHDPGIRETNYSSTVLVDFHTRGTPWFVIINPEGIVVFNDFHIDANKITQILEKELKKM
ncbi:MAG: thiol-disulfide isomerase [Candidatus Cloacimonadota bacterium]|nr:MAG: thiol-disulfide isomerase [Candidatus Cloacimonadota bacterium]